MPWKTADVDAHSKGLSDKAKVVWVKVANRALAACEEKGGKNCDASAIRQANAVAKNVGEAECALFENEEYADALCLLLERLIGASGVAQADIVGTLIRAGYDPADILEQFGLPPIKHLGLPPVTVQSAPGTSASPFGETADVELDSDLVPLAEKSVRADGTVPIKIIQPGWGSSGYYPAEVLERDGPKVFQAGTQMYIDHPTSTEESERPERSLRDLAGELMTTARWEPNGPAGAGLYADAQVFRPWQPVIEELAPHIGVSIRALGKTEKGEAEGKTGPIVQELVAAKSVDYVTAPGAGGKVLQLIESARNSIARGGRKEEDKNMELLEEVTKARDEALAKIKELEEAAVPLEAEVKRLREVILLREAADIAREALAKTDLPDITQARLTESLGKSPPIKEGQLDKEAFATVIDEAAKAEVAYLAEVKGTGQIKGMGSTGGADDHKTLEESWKHMHPDWSEAQIRVAVDGR